MATQYQSIGNELSPDNSGDVHFEAYKAINASFVWDAIALTFNDSSTEILAYGTFVVPGNYSAGAKINVWFFSTANTGNCRWEFKYAILSADNTLTEATAETISVNQAVSSTQWGWTKATLTLTAGNFAAGNNVVFSIARDGADAADTMAADAHVGQLVFEYTD